MKNIILFPFVILSLGLVLSGSTNLVKPTITVEVVREFTLSEETQDYLHRMYTVVMDNPSSNELAFANFFSPIQVVITDYNGEFVDRIGKEGRGPDEIQDTRYFGFDSYQNMVVLDKTSAFFKHHNRSSGDVRSYESLIREGVHVTTRNLEPCGEYWYLGVEFLGEGSFEQVPIIGVFDEQFKLVEKLGGYDPFFAGRIDLMREIVVSVDCEKRLVYTTHGKTPYIQVFSMDRPGRVHRTIQKPPSFNLSNKFIPMVGEPREHFRYLAREQSISLHLEHSEHHIYHVFRNEHDNDKTERFFNDRDYYVAVYDIDTYE